MIGVDVLPAQPPRGVSTIQGDFLSPSVQAEVRNYVLDSERGRPRHESFSHSPESDAHNQALDESQQVEGGQDRVSDEATTANDPGYIDMERSLSADPEASDDLGDDERPAKLSRKKQDQAVGRVVDVVLSDMCEPWDQTTGFGKRSISDPYRMMNTSGVAFKDHAGSMVSPNTRPFENHPTVFCLLISVFHLGPLRSRPYLWLRHASTRGSLHLQVLSGRRG